MKMKKPIIILIILLSILVDNSWIFSALNLSQSLESLSTQLTQLKEKLEGLKVSLAELKKNITEKAVESESTPLHDAIMEKDIDKVSNILKQSESTSNSLLSKKNQDGLTPLELAKKLLNLKEEEALKASDWRQAGWLQECLVAIKKLKKILYDLQKPIQKINSIDDKGNTLLYYAIEQLDEEGIKEMQKQSPSPFLQALNIKNANDLTPLDLAKEIFYEQKMTANNASGIFRYQVEGEAINKRDAADRIITFLEQYLSAKEKIDAKDKDGNTALHLAVQGLNDKKIKLLLKQNRPENIEALKVALKSKNESGFTPRELAEEIEKNSKNQKSLYYAIWLLKKKEEDIHYRL